MFFLILAVIITSFVIMFGQYNQIDLPLGLMYTDIKFKMPFMWVTIITFVLGFFTGLFVMVNAFWNTAIESGRLRRQLEKTSVGVDDSGLKVRTLEHKIETLEAALEKALQENNEEDED